jgi:23S rRNA (cytosine1962-C5)-methyltransferase
MLLETFNKFKDFELLDTGTGQRLERWGKFILVRPDPQIIWPRHLSDREWGKADAVFETRGEKGHWNIKTKLPSSWMVNYNDKIKLVAKLSPFKHTGIFAEQAAQWDWLADVIKKTKNPLRILNLFAYTGGATMVLTQLGHQVTHVDASKPAISWAKENQTANKLAANSIRWILDDAAKFVQRELKRGQTYDGIIMDPPAFGHSPSGKTWKFNHDLPALLRDCANILSSDAKFILINGYATNSSALALHNILEDVMAQRSGNLEFGELCLKQKDARLISTGIFARWSN